MRGLWSDSSLVDAKGKKLVGGQRSNVGTITSTSQRPLRHHQPIPQPIGTYISYSPHQYRPQAPPQLYDQTYLISHTSTAALCGIGHREASNFIPCSHTTMLCSIDHKETSSFIP